MRLLLAFIFVVVLSNAMAQEKLRYYVTISGNYYLPRDSEKEFYPILGYDKSSDPDFMVGGLGAGVTAIKDLNQRFLLKGQANLSRRAYWDKPLTFRDDHNQNLGVSQGKGVDLVLNWTAAAHFRLSKTISVGTGIGMDNLMFSNSKYDFGDKKLSVSNRYYRTFIPVVPLEFTVASEKIMFNFRYQHALINRYKKSIADDTKDTYSTLDIEIGFRINRKKDSE